MFKHFIDLATAMDVALVVKFASYEDFLSQHSDVRPSALSAESFSETYERWTNSTNQRENLGWPEALDYRI